MSSETDHPRQRTVAELLAEHGGAGATGRRRRRRAPDEPEDGAAPPPVGNVQAGPQRRPGAAEPDRPAPERVSPEPAIGGAPRSWTGSPEGPRPVFPQPDAPQAPSGLSPGPPVQRGPEWDQPAAAGAPPVRSLPDPRRERPTDVMTRIQDAGPDDVDPGVPGPIRQQPVEPGQEPAPDDLLDDVPGQDDVPEPEHADAGDPDGGPATMIGAAPAGAGAWHRGRVVGRRGAGVEAGTATSSVFDDHPAGLGGVDLEVEDLADLADLDDGREPVGPLDGAPDGTGSGGADGRAARSDSGSAGQAWAPVLGQWVAGAVGGAALWVAFRFLWRELPVVALAAAVLVTVGLVVVVRALLRNDDLRTTLFAVLVGLLLTVSPAILVLLGR